MKKEIKKYRINLLNQNKYVKKFIKLLNDNCNFYIAGGSVLSHVQQLKNIPSRYSDIDIYFYTDKDFEIAEKILNESVDSDEFVNEVEGLFGDNLFDKKISFINNTKFAKTAEIDGEQIQLIKKTGTPEEITAEFDIDNSKYWSLFPFETAFTYQSEITLKKLLVNEKILNNYYVIQRMSKYSTTKGLSVEHYYDKLFNYIFKDDISYERLNMNYENENLSLVDVFRQCLLMPKFYKTINRNFEQGKSLNFHDLINDITFLELNKLDELHDPMASYIIRSENKITLEPIKEKLKKYYPETLL